MANPLIFINRPQTSDCVSVGEILLQVGKILEGFRLEARLSDSTALEMLKTLRL